jgi:protein phosphatase
VPSVSIHKIEEGDTILLCSDGLTGEVLDEEIKEILSGDNVEGVADRLVEAANRMGGHDNISVIVAKFVEVGPSSSQIMPIADLEPSKNEG